MSQECLNYRKSFRSKIHSTKSFLKAIGRLKKNCIIFNINLRILKIIAISLKLMNLMTNRMRMQFAKS